ncbi:MAG: hypothetical protein ACI855_000276 [Myxococcota bacterium]
MNRLPTTSTNRAQNLRSGSVAYGGLFVGVIALLLLCCTTALAAPADRVVAVVEEELVLASELDLNAAMAVHDPQALAFWSDPDRSDIERLVDAAILRAAAGDVSLYTPSDRDVSDRVASIRATFTSTAVANTFFAQWGLTDSALGQWAQRRLVIERFVLRTLRVPPTDAAWGSELDVLLTTLRATSRIRTIREQR